MLATLPHLQEYVFPSLHRDSLTTLQINLGYKCNQQCLHCHVNAGPNRKEMMDLDTMSLVLEVLHRRSIKILDVTGGAPELNEHFRYLVSEATRLGVQVIDRCNLTILEEPDQAGLAEFLAEYKVQVVASLPCYLEENVDAQRGKGTYARSINALKRLNRLGYGMPDSDLVLNLVYNPQNASLPPAQCQLEKDYRRHLADSYGISFTSLFTLANMPIQRFGSMLLSNNGFNDYMQLLQASHQDSNLDSVMCKHLVSIDWQGNLYDCDFNQMLEMPLTDTKGRAQHVRDLLNTDFKGNLIAVAGHCYGCTAGQGSSCGGALGE